MQHTSIIIISLTYPIHHILLIITLYLTAIKTFTVCQSVSQIQYYYYIVSSGMAHPIDISSPLFVTTALRLGYTKQDIEPLSLQKIRHNSHDTLINLASNQQEYYLHQKYKAYQQRRNKIIDHVIQQIKRERSTKEKHTVFNPVIKKLLEEHELRLQRKARYEERARLSKTRDLQTRKISNTVDLGRTSPNFSHSAKSSRVSKQSIKSQKSDVSAKSNTSHRARLQLVRSKEKEAQRYKKDLLRYHERESRKKIDRVHESKVSASRKLQTKSEISQQAVRERQQELDSIRNDEIRNHIEKLKYKMMKNDYIKQRQDERRVSRAAPHDSQYKRQLKNMFQQNEKEQFRIRYEQKLKTAEFNKRQLAKQKRHEMEQKVREKQFKETQITKFKQHKIFQEQQIKKQTLYYEISNLERAKQNKQEIQSEKKMRLIQSKVKQQVARSNFETIENRKKLQTQSRARQISQKMKEIKDIEEIKRKLTRERKRGASLKSNHDTLFSFY